MNKEILTKYAELKKAEKEIKQKIEALSQIVLAEIENSGNDEVTLLGYGVFVLASRRTYVYPENIQDLEKKLKETKKDAEAKGLASSTNKMYVIFKQEGLLEE